MLQEDIHSTGILHDVKVPCNAYRLLESEIHGSDVYDVIFTFKSLLDQAITVPGFGLTSEALYNSSLR